MSLAKRILLTVCIVLLGTVVLGCSSSGRTYEVRIPEGQLTSKNDSVLSELPQRTDEPGRVLMFSRGDTLVVVNDDTVEHVIGLVTVRPGETVEHTFLQTGSFEGSCTLLIGERVVIEVR
jgi:hypothetical protein